MSCVVSVCCTSACIVNELYALHKSVAVDDVWVVCSLCCGWNLKSCTAVCDWEPDVDKNTNSTHCHCVSPKWFESSCV